ncbi:MAG: FecR domain-containing protein [Polyangiaceae bacterium]
MSPGGASNGTHEERLVGQALGQLVSRAAEDAASARSSGAARARFIEAQHHATRRGRTRELGRLLLAMLVIASVAALTVAAWLVWPVTRVDYSVEGSTVSSAGYVEAPAAHEARVRFTDGSEIVLEPGARGRVVERRERGARFLIEKGAASVAVTPREGGADYTIDAGPYSVAVKGTRFEVGWTPETSRFSLEMFEGKVAVVGPAIEAELTLRVGQRLTIDGARGVPVADATAPQIESAAPAEPAASVLASAPVLTTETSSATTASAATTESAVAASSVARGPTWAERSASGDFAGIVGDAEARGIEATLSSAPAGDLMILADAARFTGKAALASQALRSVRARFAGTRAASTAAFLLGRIAEDGGRSREAIQLYEAAVSEGSPLASEALGREMVLVSKASGASAAAPLARRYLKSFPRGAYAELAKKLAE